MDVRTRELEGAPVTPQNGQFTTPRGLLGMQVLGHVHTNTIRPWLLRILEFALVESVTGFCLILNECDFGLHPITFSKTRSSIMCDENLGLQ